VKMRALDANDSVPSTARADERVAGVPYFLELGRCSGTAELRAPSARITGVESGPKFIKNSYSATTNSASRSKKNAPSGGSLMVVVGGRCAEPGKPRPATAGSRSTPGCRVVERGARG
jgi:hypothetical protein